MEVATLRKKNIIQDYDFIKSNIKKDLTNLGNVVEETLEIGAKKVLTEFGKAFRKNVCYISDSIDALVLDVNDALKGNRIEDAVCEEVVEPKMLELKTIMSETEGKKKEACVSKSSYKSRLEELCQYERSAKMTELTTILSGEYCCAYSLKSRKPQRLWSWKSRLEHIESMMKDYVCSVQDKKYLQEIKQVLKSNKYLRRKRKETYAKLTAYLNLF
jgi:hypothetical protein